MKQKPFEKTNTVLIDAQGKILGRLAQEVATRLRGKDKPAFLPYKHPEQKVVVYNTDKIKVTGKKMEQKIYYHHSGYPGGLKEEPLNRLMERDSRKVIYSAVSGMLPKNKLRAKALKNLLLFKEELPEKLEKSR